MPPNGRRQYGTPTSLTEKRKELLRLLKHTDRTDTAHVGRFLDALQTFVEQQLHYPLPPCFENSSDVRAGIVACERFLVGKTRSGSESPSDRHSEFRDGFKRLRLHADIIESLLTKPRPHDESQISIAVGGACPTEGAGSQSRAFFVTGLPACGKSTIVRHVFQKARAMVLDPDDAKKMLPEYKGGKNSLPLHEESSKIIKGTNGLLDCVLDRGWNFIMPTIGADADHLREVRNRLIDTGYKVTLLYVHCEPEIAAIRSLQRLADDGRYVPLELILSTDGSPSIAFKAVVKDPEWAGWAKYDVNGPDRKAVLDGFSGVSKTTLEIPTT
jgi:predicted kinase